MPHTGKKNFALFTAFKKLAESLRLPVREDETDHEYDSLAVGRRPLKNALCIKEQSTTFFTSDKSLLDRLNAAGFKVTDAPFRNPSPHNRYRYWVSGVVPSSLSDHPQVFSQLLKDSVAYIESPIAGSTTKNIQRA